MGLAPLASLSRVAVPVFQVCLHYQAHNEAVMLRISCLSPFKMFALLFCTRRPFLVSQELKQAEKWKEKKSVYLISLGPSPVAAPLASCMVLK